MKKISKSNIICKWPISLQEERWNNKPTLYYPENLPIVQIKDHIIQMIKNHQVIIVAAETGSGKSTQLPKFLLEAQLGKKGKIACIQPRRIAATSIAKRIAFELKEPLGQSVGYRIRFDDQTSSKTFIQIMTDGMLLSELHHDILLSEYDAIVIDEAHERSLNIDLLLGLLKKLLLKRSDFKIIIASATIDTEKFSSFFHSAPIIHARGRTYDVEIRYQESLKQDEDILDKALRALETISEESSSNSILVFLPTEDFILNFIHLAKKLSCKEKRVFLPLYARLGIHEQQKIFHNVDGRKIIVATNIAETSITLPDIHYVIDSGLARISQYSSQSRIQNLPITAISQAAANQRAGRCGRVSNGVCIRLYSQIDFQSRQPHTEPEIKRANLSETILRMMAMNILEPENFEFIDKPHNRLFTEGFKTLFELKAITSLKKSNRKLTVTGKTMSSIPLDPRLSRILITAQEEGSLEDATIITCALSIMDLRSVSEATKEKAYMAHKKFQMPGSDLLWYLNLYHIAREQQLVSKNQLKRFCQEHYLHYMRVYEWLSLKNQISSLLKEKNFIFSEIGLKRLQQEIPSEKHFSQAYTAIHRAILSGYLSQVGFYQKKELVDSAKNKKKQEDKIENYVDTRLQKFTLFPTSSLSKQQWPCIFAGKMWRTSRLFAKDVVAMDVSWLKNLADHLLTVQPSEPFYSSIKQEVVCTETCYLYSYAIEKHSNRSYIRHNIEHATLLFINQALIQEEIIKPLLNEGVFDFLKHNIELEKNIEQTRAKLRRESVLINENAISDFYRERIKGIAGVAELRKKILLQPDWKKSLFLTEEDVIIDPSLLKEVHLFPDSIHLNDTQVYSEYIFEPQSNYDGTAVVLTPKQLEDFSDENELLWHPEGLLQTKILSIIKQIPKNYRIRLHPINTTVARIFDTIERKNNFFQQLHKFCCTNFHTNIPVNVWKEAYEKIDNHLKLQFVIRNDPLKGKDLIRSHCIENLKKTSFSSIIEEDFIKLKQIWEIQNLQTWPINHPKIPTSIEVKNSKGEVYSQVYPAFYCNPNNQIDLKLFEHKNMAEAEYLLGISKLLSICLKKELIQMKKNFQFKEMLEHFTYWGNYKEANQYFDYYIHSNYLRDSNVRTLESFNSYDSSSKRKEIWQGVAEDFSAFESSIKEYTFLYKKIHSSLQRYHQNTHLVTLKENLDGLAGQSAWRIMSKNKLRRLPALLKIWHIRLDRALMHLAKDKEKSLTFQIYHTKVKELLSSNINPLLENKLKQFSHILYEVELKTLVPEAKGITLSKKELEEAFIML